MQRHLDGVRLLPEQGGDVLRLQVGAVAERDQLAVADAKGRDRVGEVEPQDDELRRAVDAGSGLLRSTPILGSIPVPLS